MVYLVQKGVVFRPQIEQQAQPCLKIILEVDREAEQCEKWQFPPGNGLSYAFSTRSVVRLTAALAVHHPAVARRIEPEPNNGPRTGLA